jgi:hypothetical protein
MPTERYHPLATGWLDAGPTPCILQLKTVACVMVAVGSSPPADDAGPAHCLSYTRDGADLLPLPMEGERVFLRSQVAPDHIAPEVVVSRGRIGSGWASPPCDWQPPVQAAIARTDTYQVLFPAGSALHGGTIVNTSPPGSPPLHVDVTGAMGPDLSAAAIPVYPALDPTTAPGAWRVPPTRGAVTIRGQAGAIFVGFSA